MKSPFFADPDPLSFAPPLLRLQDSPPNPLGRAVLRLLLALLAALLVWALLGRLDIVAVAEGRLVPHSYVKIVQPAESGIVKDILVQEGQIVHAGDVLMRMDALMADADARSLDAEYRRKRMALARIDAELDDRPFRAAAGAPPALAREVAAQYRANRAALAAALAEEESRLVKARHDLASAEQVQAKLLDVLPHYRQQDQAFEKLARDGYAGGIMAGDKRRERIEKEQDLKTQAFMIESTRASILQAQKKLAQIDSDYRRALHAERGEAQNAVDKLGQELAKQSHRQALLDLKAPQEGVVKDLATHTSGTVVQPGTVLLTLVPRDEKLRAEVWVSNEDIGFVRAGQAVKVKLAAFPFQKYGMANKGAPPLYKALVSLQAMHLTIDGQRFSLGAGMQASAEILLGTRTVMEYLLSPVRKAWHEAGRER